MSKYLKTREGSLEDLAKQMQNKVLESDYQDKFKKELDKAGRPIGQMTGAEKKAFFNKLDKMHTAKNEQVIKEKKNYKNNTNFFVNDKTDTLKKMTGRRDYSKRDLLDYLAQKTNKKEDDVYFDDTDLVYIDKTVLKDAETKTVDQMLKALQKEAVDNPYAVGMAQAMKAKDDQPPLKKSTITKAHDIAKSIEKDIKEGRFEVSGTVSYKGVNSSDDFEIVIDAPNEQAAEKKIDDMIFKARNKGEIGPRGGRGVEDYEIYNIEPTTNKVTNKFVTSQASEKQIEEVEIKEGDAYQNDRFAVSGNTAKIDNANTSDKSNHIYAPNAKTAVAMYKAGVKSYKDNAEMRRKFPMAVEEVQETHSFITNKQNQKQKEVGGEKEPIKTTKNEWKTFAMMAAELREKKEQKKEDKKEMQAGDDTRDKKQKTMTGEIATSPEMNPKVDYKY
jgi:hypothetical protein